MKLPTSKKDEPGPVPDFVQQVVLKLSAEEGITIEQATRLLLFQGAVYYEAVINKKGAK